MLHNITLASNILSNSTPTPELSYVYGTVSVVSVKRMWFSEWSFSKNSSVECQIGRNARNYLQLNLSAGSQHALSYSIREEEGHIYRQQAKLSLG